MDIGFINRFKNFQTQPQTPSKSPILVGLVIIAGFLITISLASQVSDKFGLLSLRKQLQKLFAKEEVPSEAALFDIPDGYNAKESYFVSNELLVKFKEDTANKIPDETSQKLDIKELDDIGEKVKVAKVEKILKPKGKRPDSKSQEEKSLGQWHLITLSTPKKVIKSKNLKENFIKDNDLKNLIGAVAMYKKSVLVETVQPNYIYKTTQTATDSALESTLTATLAPSPTPSPVVENVLSNNPNDYYYSDSQNLLWNLKKINTEGAWQTTKGNKNIVVAVSDSGIDFIHSDLADNAWINVDEVVGNGVDDDNNGYVDDVNGWDFAFRDNNPNDAHGHGTHVAGTIGAVGNNDADQTSDIGKRIVGVNWNVSIMGVRGLDKNGYGSTTALAAGIIYAADNGASVINMSWGGSGADATVGSALEYASSKGVILIAAAGNSATTASSFTPANSPYVIAVSSSNESDSASCFTNYGTKVDVGAPGGDSSWCGGTGKSILSARATNTDMYGDGSRFVPSGNSNAKYILASGTSMAAPHVAGVVALIKSKNPDYSSEEIRYVLRNSADKINNKDWDLKLAWGRLNSGKAVNYSGIPPIAKITSPAHGYFFGNEASVGVHGLITSRTGNPTWSLDVGVGEEPSSWKNLATGTGQISTASQLGTLSFADLPPSSPISIRLRVESSGVTSEDRVLFTVDKELMAGWPKILDSVWPGAVGYGNDPAVADLNGDGKSEIIAVASFENKVYVWQTDGSLLPGWPVSLPVNSGNVFPFTAAPSVGDLNRDKIPEIAVGMADLFGQSGNQLFVLSASGQILPGWPKINPNRSNSLGTPAIGDIDGNGTNEIVYEVCGLYVYDYSGAYLPGWPKLNYVSASDLAYSCLQFASSPTLVDLDNDNKKEIIFEFSNSVGGPSTSSVLVYDYLGNQKWSVTGTKTNLTATSNVAIADINNDGQKEVLFQQFLLKVDCFLSLSCYTRNIDGYDKNGRRLPNFPLITEQRASITNLLLADLDKNGIPEIISPGSPTLEVLDLNGQKVNGWEVPIGQSYSLPSLTDYDGDFYPELLIGGEYPVFSQNQNLGLYIYKKGVGIVWKKEYAPVEVSPVSGDFDKDGKLEIGAQLATEFGSRFYLWKTSSPVSKIGSVFNEQLGFDKEHTRLLQLYKPQFGAGLDSDGDSWSDEREQFLGTDPLKACNLTKTFNDETDALPSDFNDDQRTNLSDVVLFGPYFNSLEGDTKYNKRFDLNADKRVNQSDVNLLGTTYNKSCK